MIHKSSGQFGRQTGLVATIRGAPVYIDLLEHCADGVLLNEEVPPEPPDEGFQAFWSWHHPIIWHYCSQYLSCYALIGCGRRKSPEWCCVQI